jgi:hypothetical protein
MVASISKWLILGCFEPLTAIAGEEASLVPKDSVTLRDYGIEKNFSGFSYSRIPEHRDRLDISLLPNPANQVNLVGIWMKTNEKGQLEEIGPIMDTIPEAVDHFSWAIEKFEAGHLSFNSLWEVLHAAMDPQTPDEALFRFLLETVSNSSNKPDLEKILIRPDDECWEPLKIVLPEASKKVLSVRDVIELVNRQGP